MVNGPRACGKTTSALRAARSVARLDVPAQAALFHADADAALAAFPDRPLLIDEWQEVPGVIGAIKRAADAGAPAGSFILTGSVRAPIDQQTWPGTGRLAVIEMMPLVGRELLRRTQRDDAITQIEAGSLPMGRIVDAPDVVGYLDMALAGGFPEPALALPAPARAGWYVDYIEQIADRDVGAILRRADPDRIRRYLEALALNTAGVVAHKTVYDAAAISKKTAEGYDAILRRLSIALQVPAWATNRLRQLVATPKRYLADAALVSAAARLTRADILREGNLLGRIIDTFVHSQLRAEIAVNHPNARLYHLRTDNGRHEIDLILDLGGRRIVPIEIKSGAAPTNADVRHIRWLRDELGTSFHHGVLLHTGPDAFAIDEGISACPISTLWH